MIEISQVEFSIEYDREFVGKNGLSQSVTLSSRSEFIEGERTKLDIIKKIPKNFSCSTCINRCELQALRTKRDEDWYEYYGQECYDQSWTERYTETDIIDFEFDIEDHGRKTHITKGLKFPDQFMFMGPNHPYYDGKSTLSENANQKVIIHNEEFTPVCHDCIRYMDTSEEYKYNSGRMCQICRDSEVELDTVDLKDESLPEDCKYYYEKYWSDWGNMGMWDELPCTGPIKMLPWTYDEFPEAKEELMCGRKCNRMGIKCNDNDEWLHYPSIAIDVCEDRLKSFMHSVYMHTYKNVKWRCADFHAHDILACTCANGVHFVETFCEEFDKLHDKHLNIMQELMERASANTFKK